MELAMDEAKMLFGLLAGVVCMFLKLGGVVTTTFTLKQRP